MPYDTRTSTRKRNDNLIDPSTPPALAKKPRSGSHNDLAPNRRTINELLCDAERINPNPDGDNDGYGSMNLGELLLVESDRTSSSDSPTNTAPVNSRRVSTVQPVDDALANAIPRLQTSQTVKFLENFSHVNTWPGSDLGMDSDVISCQLPSEKGVALQGPIFLFGQDLPIFQVTFGSVESYSRPDHDLPEPLRSKIRDSQRQKVAQDYHFLALMTIRQEMVPEVPPENAQLAWRLLFHFSADDYDEEEYTKFIRELPKSLINKLYEGLITVRIDCAKLQSWALKATGERRGLFVGLRECRNIADRHGGFQSELTKVIDNERENLEKLKDADVFWGGLQSRLDHLMRITSPLLKQELTAEVTAKVTAEVTAKVTAEVTAEVTARVTAEQKKQLRKWVDNL